MKAFGIILLFLISAVICAEDFYKLLNINRGATEREIKKAYRTLSKKFHPDKNPGDDSASQKFVEIAEAYEALSDPEQRKIYDKYGHEGLAQHKAGGGHGGGGDPFDLFSRFFGGSGHYGGRGGQHGVRRGPGKEVKIEVPLRDFYKGAEHDFSIEKQQICDECEGSGSADGTTTTCDQCNGRGAVIQKHMLAPGIFQQMQMQCDRCAGKGKVIKTPCKVCSGSRVVKRVVNHLLHVEKGMPNGVRITYDNEADESPDWEAADLVVTLEEEAANGLPQEEQHRSDGAFMTRKGRNLYWKEVLSLREAWMGGWHRDLIHMDGHVIHLSRPRGQVVQAGSIEVVANEGMPIWLQEQDRDNAGAEEFGNLIVEYQVVLPDMMPTGMEKEFWHLWEKWHKKNGIADLDQELGRPDKSNSKAKEEL